MLSMPFAIAPAGVLGSGSVVVRPYACADVRPWALPPVAAVPGTGASFAGTAERRGADLLIGSKATAAPSALSTTRPSTQHDPITQNDGTTLGIHPRGRSTS
jgi:hypothetical protein